MTFVTLPKLKQTGKNEYADVEDNDVAIREVLNGNLDNTNIAAGAGITGAKLAENTVERKNLVAEAKPVKWYTPTIIATEESRENTAFGTLTTPDEITGVVLPTNGLILVGYIALWKQSVEKAGRAAIFLGANQLKMASESGAPAVQEAAFTTNAGHLSTLTTTLFGLSTSEVTVTDNTFVTTGQLLARSGGLGEPAAGGFSVIFAAAGTYAVSVKYKATSGKVTVKERKLLVGVLGATA